MSGLVERLRVDAGRIRLVNADGRVALDTDRRMFFITDKLNGTLSIPARTNIDTSIDLQQTHTLGSCNPDAVAVMGAYRFLFASGQETGVIDGIWHPAGGTVMHFVSPGNRILGEYRFVDTDGYTISHMSAYTFRCEGGHVYLDEDVYAMRLNSGDAGAGDVTGYVAFDIDYKLLIGAFDL